MAQRDSGRDPGSPGPRRGSVQGARRGQTTLAAGRCSLTPKSGVDSSACEVPGTVPIHD